MSLENDILVYGNRAQTRIAELGVLVEEQLRQGIDYTEASTQAKELMMFQESLFSTLCPWTDDQKATWIAWMTDRHKLAPVPYVDYDLYVAPVVRPPSVGDGDYVTHPQLADAVQELENTDAELDERITALENRDYSDLIPDSLLDDVSSTKSGLETALELIDELQNEFLDLEDDLADHIADTSKHVQTGERAAWNAKVSAAQLSDGLAGKANTNHSHSISHVTGLQSALDSLQDQLNSFPEPEPGEDGQTPNIQIGDVTVGDEPSVEIDEESTPEAPVLNFVLPKGEPGEPFQFDAIDTFANRSLYDDNDPGFNFLAYDTGNYYVLGESSWGPAIPFKGWNGWSPKFALYTVSADKEVLEIIDWFGGTGDKPQLPLLPDQDPDTARFFIGESGIVLDADSAKNVKGPTGGDGRSAYDVAVANGFEGSEEEWLESLHGEDGDNGDDGLSAYEIAVNNGFEGTEEEWIESLEGEIGSPGLSAYEVAVTNGFEGTEEEWLESIQGTDGDDGSDGISAYEVAVANGFEGTEEEWLASLHADTGSMKTQTFIASGSDDTFTVDNGTINSVAFVFINGVLQTPGYYTVDGNDIVFPAAVPADAKVVVAYVEVFDLVDVEFPEEMDTLGGYVEYTDLKAMITAETLPVDKIFWVRSGPGGYAFTTRSIAADKIDLNIQVPDLDYDYYKLDLDNDKILAYDDITCIVRHTAGAWTILSDADHVPKGIASISEPTTSKMRLTYDKTYTKVLSLVATPDETYAKQDFRIGASVGLSYSEFEFSTGGVFGTISESGGSLTVANQGVQTAISGVTFDSGTGNIVVTHAQLNALAGVSILPMNAAHRPVLIGSNGTTVTCRMINNSDAVVTSATGIAFQLIRAGSRILNNSEMGLASSNFWIKGLMMTEISD